MGDFSSTFTIHNRLNFDLSFVSASITHGYWLRGPQQTIPACTVSNQMQIKDNVGLVGTQAIVKYKLLDGASTVTVLEFDLACPYDKEPNRAFIKSVGAGSSKLFLAVSGYQILGHPTVVEFVVERKRT